jgi:hypothetical protein
MRKIEEGVNTCAAFQNPAVHISENILSFSAWTLPRNNLAGLYTKSWEKAGSPQSPLIASIGF